MNNGKRSVFLSFKGNRFDPFNNTKNSHNFDCSLLSPFSTNLSTGDVRHDSFYDREFKQNKVRTAGNSPSVSPGK